MSSQNKIDILGVKIDTSKKESIIREIQVLLKNKKKFVIVTPNPEQVLLSQKDKDFMRILNSADFSLPDGVGLVHARSMLTQKVPDSRTLRFLYLILIGAKIGLLTFFDRKSLEKDFSVIRGREFFLDLIALANKKGLRVFLLGGEGDEAEKTKKKLEANYKNVKIASSAGPVLTKDGNPKTPRDSYLESQAINEINETKPHILFVAFGAPKQEKWISQNLKNLDIGGAMVVGVTFRYVAGIAKLPPKLIAGLGLEWLWRLLTGSQKLSRIISALVKFPICVFLHKMKSN